MHVYHRQGAGRPLRVLWALEEAGLPYDLTILSPDEAAGEEHRRRHPLGRVPVIETGGTTVFESTGLVLHVAELAPDAGLLPPVGSPERALVYQWMMFAMTELEPPLLEVFRYRETIPAVVDGASARSQQALDAIERALGGVDHIAGDAFSVADIVVSHAASFAGLLGVGEAGPNVDAYIGRMRERPARQRAEAAMTNG